MESYDFLFVSAIILLSTKVFGILSERVHMPQVVGALTVGIILGPSCFNVLHETDFLLKSAEIGVILLMFQAGLDTEFEELKKNGKASFIIALIGVIVPFIGGTIVYLLFFRDSQMTSTDLLKGCFVGVILTATSVSISVETLKEMGKLKGKVGTTILSAAIIDDVIGIIVLTFVIGLKSPDSKPISVIINTVLFFVFAIIVGFISYKIFKMLDKRYPHTRRIPIASIAFCFLMSYVAERYFGIADITGAYVSGIILCSINDSSYIERKVDVNSYIIFGPVFFASIGLKTNIDNITGTILLFSLGFVVVGLISKIIGCGLMAKLCKFNGNDSLKIGVGMMTRGEVALIVAQRGLSVGLLEPIYFTSVIFLIIVSSILTPIILKILYSKDKEPDKVQTA